jgi:hypothetical protein
MQLQLCSFQQDALNIHNGHNLPHCRFVGFMTYPAACYVIINYVELSAFGNKLVRPRRRVSIRVCTHWVGIANDLHKYIVY